VLDLFIILPRLSPPLIFAVGLIFDGSSLGPARWFVYTYIYTQAYIYIHTSWEGDERKKEAGIRVEDAENRRTQQILFFLYMDIYTGF